MAPGLDDDLALAHRLADAADAISLAGFTGAVVAHELKADGSPVSAVDRAVEGRIDEMLAAERPADGMLGEEVGARGPAGRRWIVDGIDGTILFVAGRTGWATQIALEVDGEVVAGVTTVPAGGRRWWAARGRGAWTRDRPSGEPTPVRVSGGGDLARARYSLIPPREAITTDAGADLVARLAAATGAGGDYVPPHEHGALFVADGRAEACLQVGGGPWDFAALSVLVAGAGGRWSDLAGRPDIYGGGPLLFSNGGVHEAALGALAA